MNISSVSVSNTLFDNLNTDKVERQRKKEGGREEEKGMKKKEERKG